MTSTNPLFEFAGEWLDRIVAHYANEGYDLPDRQFIAPGIAAWDCPQVWISLGTGRTGALGRPEAGPIHCTSPLQPTLTARIARCVTVKAQPTDPDVLTDEAEPLWRDLWQVHRVTAPFLRDPAWFSSEGQGRVDGIGLDGPQGGITVAFYTISLTITP